MSLPPLNSLITPKRRQQVITGAQGAAATMARGAPSLTQANQAPGSVRAVKSNPGGASLVVSPTAVKPYTKAKQVTRQNPIQRAPK